MQLLVGKKSPVEIYKATKGYFTQEKPFEIASHNFEENVVRQ